MKAEIGENHVKLIPETDFEVRALNAIGSNIIENTEFEDNWNKAGSLTLKFKKHPFENE